MTNFRTAKYMPDGTAIDDPNELAALNSAQVLDVQTALEGGGSIPGVTTDANGIGTLLADSLTQYIAPPKTLAQILALSAATYAGMTVRCTDVGRGGSHWYSDGMRWRVVGGVLDLVTTKLTSSGGASNFVLGEAAIPAGLWQAGDEIEMLPSPLKSGSSETASVGSFIGTVSGAPLINLNIGTGGMAGAVNQISARWAWTRVSATSVVATSITGGVGYGPGTAPLAATVSNLDSVPQFIQFVLNSMSASTETISLRSFRVRLHTCGA